MHTDARRVTVRPGQEAIVEFDPSLTFECVDACTWCCHHGVLLYDRDLHGLAERTDITRTTTRVRGEPFVRREEKDRTDHVDEEGCACAMLDDDGRCSVQADTGWKPTRCWVFPLAVWREGDSLHVDVRKSARTHCEGLSVGERRIIDHLEEFLPPTLWELEDPDTNTRL